MAEPRELILKLGQKITDRIGVKVTENDPEYWGLASVVTDEMAEVALAMKVRVPVTAAEVAKKCKKSVERTEELLEEMSVIGVIEYNWENEDHHKQYVLPMFVPGCAEFMVMNKEQVEEHTEIADFFEQMARLPLEKVTPMVPLGGAGIGMHVIPVEKAIPANQQSASVEHISHWLNKYDKYSVGACSCRRQQRIRGEGTGDLEDDLCIGVGDMADYCVETGKGRYIDYDEVMEILQRAEDNGYVHQITNIDGEDKIFAICNCAVGVCNALRTSQLFNTPNMSRSAYRASVEPEKCVACGRCVEYCPAGAAKLGQKLCTKDGGHITYPQQELPDTTKWGPEKWNPNYRDDNQINCYDTGTAPCKTACPAHLPVQGYIKMASQGRYLDALKLIKTENPFPAVCGAICNRRCEDACTRGTIDQAVAIDEIKKFIAEQELHAEKRYIPPMLNYSGKPFEEKVAVIGAGPAGISAGIYAASRGKKVLITEKNTVGGLIGKVSTVTHYAGIMTEETGSSFAKRLKIQAENTGIDIIYEEVTQVELQGSIKKVFTKDGAYDAKKIVLANGTTPRKLNIPGEAELTGKGMGMNAQRDGRKYTDKNIYVVGGADGAVKEALYLSKFAKQVTIIHFEDTLGCIEEFKNKAEQTPNIKLRLGSRLHAVYGAEQVEALEISDEKTGSVEKIADCGCGIFVYAGTTPNTELYSELELDNGFIPVDENMETNIAGVYAVGDIRVKQVRQVSTAVADGTVAGIHLAK